MKKVLCFCLSLLILLSLCSCAAKKDTENSLVGQWKIDSNSSAKSPRIPRKIEFFSDGIVTGDDLGGKYSVEGDRLNIYYTAQDTYTYIYSFNDGKLVLKYSETEEYTYSKVSNEDLSEASDAPQLQMQSKLSSDCDYVLAKGTNKNGDVYELVANQSKSFDGKAEVGVIKNNKWLVALTSNSPFVDENGGIIDFKNWEWRHNEKSVYYFVGNSCFMLPYAENTTDGTRKSYVRFFNAETQKSLVCEGYIVQYTEVFMVSDPQLIYKEFEENIFIQNGLSYTLINLNEMKEVNQFKAGEFYCESPFSEGLFFSKPRFEYENTIAGFYDEDGTLVIDLSKYNMIIDNMADIYFENGKCTFKANNESGAKWLITIDKTGKVLSEEPV